MIKPLGIQKKLNIDDLIIDESQFSGEEDIPLDVVFVGAGPAGLSGAIKLAQLSKKENLNLEIGVLEKASELGGHSLSGAVINPKAFLELFNEKKIEDFPFKNKITKEKVLFLTKNNSFRLPTPPTMHNKGNYTASLCEIVKFLGKEAENLGINIFTGFPAKNLLLNGNKITGVRTTPSGLNRDSSKGPQHTASVNIKAKITVLCEGSRGPLAQSYIQKESLTGRSQQIYALGVKELWQVPKNLDHIVHTLAWPLDSSDFGGSWIYPMGENKVSIGLVIGLDYKKHSVDVHTKLQHLKQHPVFKKILKGGKILEWGAKTIPEGGWDALPTKLYGDNILIAGDAAGFVNVPALKGIHYSMYSGIFAAQSAFEALKKEDCSKNQLSSYQEMINNSFIKKDLTSVKEIRPSFKKGFIIGGIKAGLLSLKLNALVFKNPPVKEDAEEVKSSDSDPETLPVNPDINILSKVDGVYLSGNKTRDDIPCHLNSEKDIDKKTAEFYAALCPAGVYEWQDNKLVINSPNCIDCKATDVLGPRWEAREGGSGPNYKEM
ncbi:MAG: NAD(P)-binding protein [Bdellovibrionales bacterium]|nr:NAD(P)-binding protein [Bdellovibrionales bacterium]